MAVVLLPEVVELSLVACLVRHSATVGLLRVSVAYLAVVEQLAQRKAAVLLVQLAQRDLQVDPLVQSLAAVLGDQRQVERGAQLLGHLMARICPRVFGRIVSEESREMDQPRRLCLCRVR